MKILTNLTRSLLASLLLTLPQSALALTGFSATMDSSNLSYSYSYSGAPSFLHVYIDSDKSTATGYSIAGIGADYLIENNAIYRFSGATRTTWGWASMSISPNQVKAAPTVKWTVSRAALGNPSALNAVANTSAGDSSNIVSQTMPSTVPSPSPSPSTSTVYIDYFGDSTAHGDIGGTPYQVARPPSMVMDENLPSNYVVKNEAVGGASVKELLAGTDGVHAPWPTTVARSNAKYMIMNYSINDSYEVGTTTATYKESYRQVIDLARAAGKIVILQTTNPTNNNQKDVAFSTAMKEVAAEKNVPVIDVFTYLSQYMAANKLGPYQITNDGIHPTQATYILVGEYTAKRFKEIVGLTTVSPSPVPSPAPSPAPLPSGATASVSFTANNSAINNPERGFFMTTDCRANPQGVTQLQNWKAKGHTVYNCLFYLREFRNSPISSTVLAQLQTQLDNARTAGMKLILRFVYTNTDINDAPLNIVQGHLDQLAPYLRNNVDVIATVQAGIVGQWGEMQASSNYGSPSTAADYANRKAVIDKLLAVIPSSRMVAVRQPVLKMQPYGSTPLSSSEAYSGSARSRVSHYNDCFISSANDWGTYLSAGDRTFMQQDSKYTAVSGETCSLSSYNDCGNAVNEMTQHHWSLLHEGYNADVIAKFKTQGCYDTIKSRLGYRLQLQNATLSTSARVGGAIKVAFSVANTGFSALYNPRPVQLILRNASSGAVIRLPLNVDPRRWEPGTTAAIDQSITLPSTIPAGTYAMLLALPDAATNLQSRPDYSIQLANTGIWESSTGFNNLKLNLVVSP